MIVALKIGRAFARWTAPLAFACIALTPAIAAQDTEAEKKKLLECEKDICSIIVGKQKSGPNLACDLAKTWAGEDIEKGAQEKSVSWGFGSTRCSVKFNAKREDIVNALTAPQYTLKVERQTVSCEIERGSEKYPIKMTLAPQLKFKDGKATNVGLYVDNIEGAALIKGVVWTAAALEQNFGLFESDLVREVNKFVQKECPKRMAREK